MKNKKVAILLISAIVSSMPLIGCSTKTDKGFEGIINNIINKEEPTCKLDKSGVTPATEPQKFLLESFQLNMNDKNNVFSNLEIENEDFNKYPTEVKITSISSDITELKTYKEFEELDKQITDSIANEDLYGYVLIEVGYDVKIVDKLGKRTDWGNGEYSKWYVVAMPNEGDNWEVFGIY